MAPRYTCSPPTGTEVCAVLPTKEQLLAVTLPPRLKMAPPLPCGTRSSLLTKMVDVFPLRVTPVRFTLPPRFKMAEPPRLFPLAMVKLTTVKLTLVLRENTRTRSEEHTSEI